jgi:hypothetical protein
MVYRGDMGYVADLGVQYVSFRSEHGVWPKPEEILSRLHFRDSSTRDTERIDRYDCGRYAAYTLEVHLQEDGKVQFYCWKESTKSP